MTAAQASLREIVMGSQDNLTTVLGVVLGVSIGSGDAETVALAGLAAGLAEAVSMGGVLYTATQAEIELGRSLPRSPLGAAVVTFAAALTAALIPLAPFLVLPLAVAMAVSASVALAALFALGAWKARVTGRSPWRDGLRFVAIGGIAACAAAVVGALLRTNGV